ncbi:MAG: hypothetical protein Q9190_006999 [Brigantiaea leucoxantha]
MPEISQNNLPAQDDVRSLVSQNAPSAPYTNKFENGESVWMKNPQTEFYEWLMTIVERRYDESRQDWEYKVKDSDGKIYKSGEWVPEKRFKDGQ